MFPNRKIKINQLIVLLSISLITVTSISMAYFSYVEFTKTIDERILQQLISIKRLKRIQIEGYLNHQLHLKPVLLGNKAIEIKDINYYFENINSEIRDIVIEQQLTPGLHDVTPYTSQKTTNIISIIKIEHNTFLVKLIDFHAIESILYEHTGMGESGESYLVGSDFRMRSKSRFSPNKNPNSIFVKTESVLEAFKNGRGVGIKNDYRNIPVYSAFYNIKVSNINWAILAEMDVAEVQKPLNNLKNKLWLIGSGIVTFSILLSLFIALKISSPIKRINASLKRMSQGNFVVDNNENTISAELSEAFDVLHKLQKSLSTATQFAFEIGQLNLEAKLEKHFEEDALSEALLNMKKQLIYFRSKELELLLNSKKSLIQGQEKEQTRLSKELHDGIGPLLTSLKLMIQAKVSDDENKEALKHLIDQIIKEVRIISSSLMPQSLADFGVSQALETWIALIRSNSNITIDFSESFSFNAKDLDKGTQICIFRVVQELVNNTIKHSKASLIVIDMTNSDELIYISFYDNGIGFNPIQTSKSGSGIINIRERVETLKGNILFNNSVQGTKIEIELPLTINND
jgi:two-component system, NarL family, sensor kinase